MQPETVLELNPSAGNPRNSEGAFATLADGTVLFVYTRYYGGSGDDDGAVLAACTSPDRGRTWQIHDRPLVENEAGMNVMSVSFLRLPSGELWLMYLVKNSEQDCREHFRRSRDEGRTWSAPELCVPEPGYHVTNNDRVIRLASGRILVPASRHQEPGTGRHPGHAHVLMSDDEGTGWRDSQIVQPPPRSASGLQEPGLVELRDGRVWMHCRTDTGRHWQAFSHDGGAHWSAAAPTDFIAPCSPLCVKRIPATGDLLAVWNDHSGRFPFPDPADDPGRSRNWGRTPLVCAVSPDDGTSWEHHRTIEHDFAHGYCYTAIHFVDDSVLLGYCAGGPEHGHVLCRLRMKRVPLAWLYTGG